MIDELRASLKAAHYFALFFDDSKSYGNVEFMSTEIFYVDQKTGCTTNAFIKLHPVEHVDAESLTNALVCTPNVGAAPYTSSDLVAAEGTPCNRMSKILFS